MLLEELPQLWTFDFTGFFEIHFDDTTLVIGRGHRRIVGQIRNWPKRNGVLGSLQLQPDGISFFRQNTGPGFFCSGTNT